MGIYAADHPEETAGRKPGPGDEGYWVQSELVTGILEGHDGILAVVYDTDNGKTYEVEPAQLEFWR